MLGEFMSSVLSPWKRVLTKVTNREFDRALTIPKKTVGMFLLIYLGLEFFVSLWLITIQPSLDRGLMTWSILDYSE